MEPIYVLGIDLGSTAVKVCLVDVKSREVKDSFVQDTNCELPIDIPGAHEQSVSAIIEALNSCVSKIPESLQKKITRIGICGQMHGVLFWKINDKQKPWKFDGKRYIVDEDKVSSLFTWQDARCDQTFLATLPKPNSHLGITTGYGIPTIFWLKRNKPEYLKEYNRSGLISSFVVAMLCNHEIVYTSYQNAASWGYFNYQEHEWNLNLLRKGNFPEELLPNVRFNELIVGKLNENWYSIPTGVSVGVDMGDLQCSVLSSLASLNNAVINFSTSLKLALVVNNYVPHKYPACVDSLSYWPYFNNQYIAVAVSLNGGNILDFFVNMLEGWINDLGETIVKDKIMEQLIDLGIKETNQSILHIKPTCMGERFNPNLKGSVSNVNGLNVGLGEIFQALCTGIIENLHSMLPTDFLKKAKINKIIGSGVELHKNQILRDEVERIFELPLVLTQEDASRGAALAVHQFSEPCSCAFKQK